MTASPRIVARELAPVGTLAGDWLAGREAVRRLLPLRHPDAAARDGVAALRAEAFGASSPAAAAKLRRILAGEGALVTTGQQPLLFLGPLLVLYKTLTAIALARRLEAETGRPALASFWIASDDHDWREVGVSHVLDTGNELRSLRLEPPPGHADRPAGPAPLTEAIGRKVQELFHFLPSTEFVDDYLELFLSAWSTDATLSEAFGRSLSGVLAGRELVWLDAAHPEVKSAARPLVRWALEDAGAVEQALEEGARGILGAGHETPIPTLPGATAVFLDTGVSRERLYRSHSGFRIGREGPPIGGDELFEHLASAPGDFSPNVALRPVLESHLLPVAATVLGPGELAYWTQLGGLFQAAGVPPPSVRPRAGWTLVETKVEKVLDRLRIEPEALADGGQEAARRATEAARPPEVREALSDLRRSLGRELEQVEARVSESLPGIRSAVGKARAEAFRTVAELESQVDARVREREEVLLAQIRKAALHLFPDGRPQERVLSPLYYLARYGPALLAELERETRTRVAARGEPG